MEQVLGAFAPLLQAIVAATADESQRDDIDQVLTGLEGRGWMLRPSSASGQVIATLQPSPLASTATAPSWFTACCSSSISELQRAYPSSF